MPSSARTPAPVHWLPADSPDKPPSPGIALCLSGGGYRAMLFHLGATWRLNELGYLKRLARVSSVSGGSITAGVLARNWNTLEFGADAKAPPSQFESQIVHPIRALASATIDVWSIAKGALPWHKVSDAVADYYRSYLFGAATLQDLPDNPRFVINSTNVQSGVLWRFSKPYMADWRVGMIRKPAVSLAFAVAASSAFPPFLSPAYLDLQKERFEPGSGHDLQKPPFTTQAVLTDGGVYDNLGLETAWKNYITVLASDGGMALAPEEHPSSTWPLHIYRVLNVINNQVGSLRKRELIRSYELPAENPLRGPELTGESAVTSIHTRSPMLHPMCSTRRPVRLSALARWLRRAPGWSH
jgi:NTE family protein